MSTPLAYALRHAKSLRRKLLGISERAERTRNLRNLIARDLLAPQGPFRPKVKPSRRRPYRHPRHRQRYLDETMA